jgi:hypothetical protein
MRNNDYERPIWYFIPAEKEASERSQRSNAIIISALCLLVLGLLLVGIFPQLGAGLS